MGVSALTPEATLPQTSVSPAGTDTPLEPQPPDLHQAHLQLQGVSLSPSCIQLSFQPPHLRLHQGQLLLGLPGGLGLPLVVPLGKGNQTSVCISFPDSRLPLFPDSPSHTLRPKLPFSSPVTYFLISVESHTSVFCIFDAPGPSCRPYPLSRLSFTLHPAPLHRVF